VSRFDDAVAALKGAVDAVKASGQSDLMMPLLETQRLTYEMGAENRELRRRVEELERALELKGQLRFRRGSYWLTDADEETSRSVPDAGTPGAADPNAQEHPVEVRWLPVL
jgi:hypothetical protein